MTYKVSPAVLDVFPTLEWLLAQTKSAACKRDRGICIRDLHVDVQRHRLAHRVSGLAFPQTTTYRSKGRTRVHLNGRILLSLGDDCCDQNIIFLYAHELRHIGQFHRGLHRYGHMTIRPLTDAESEADADSFATELVESLSYVEINPSPAE